MRNFRGTIPSISFVNNIDQAKLHRLKDSLRTKTRSGDAIEFDGCVFGMDLMASGVSGFSDSI